MVSPKRRREAVDVLQRIFEVSERRACRAKGKGLSKSTASRMWVAKSLEQLQHPRKRPLDQVDLVTLMISGIQLAEGVWVIVALGIDLEGNKPMLDFEQGSSENATAVGELIGRLKKRGVGSEQARRLLIVRDASRAIKKAVNKHWASAVPQECLEQMQRHPRDNLRARDRSFVAFALPPPGPRQGSRK